MSLISKYQELTTHLKNEWGFHNLFLQSVSSGFSTLLELLPALLPALPSLKRGEEAAWKKCIKHSRNPDTAFTEITMLCSKECYSHFILCEFCPWNSPFCSTCAQHKKHFYVFWMQDPLENIQIKVNFRGKLCTRIISIRIHQGSESVGSKWFFSDHCNC